LLSKRWGEKLKSQKGREAKLLSEGDLHNIYASRRVKKTTRVKQWTRVVFKRATIVKVSRDPQHGEIYRKTTG